MLIPRIIMMLTLVLGAAGPVHNVPPRDRDLPRMGSAGAHQTGGTGALHGAGAAGGTKKKAPEQAPPPEIPDEEMALWPEIAPYETGYLKVSGIHEIYYDVSGDAGGKPVFVLHGGPGGHTSPYSRRFFNPQKFMIVLHDQRGAGRSKPSGELRENTTQHLVEDIERLRKHLKCGQIILFGGSWGSTLALAYAETYPGHVAGMVLRGLFTAEGEDIDFFYHGGVRFFFPDAYEALLAVLPDPDRRPLHQYLYELLQTDNEADRRKLSRAWAAYEIKISGLEVSDELVRQIVLPEDRAREIYVFSLFENYYMANGCFLEEGQLFRDADKIRHIPAVIINGRYDIVCPPDAAYDLHKILPRSRLIIAESAGHWMGEPPVEQALLRAMKAFEPGKEKGE
jgi:proline iminopeptidase